MPTKKRREIYLRPSMVFKRSVFNAERNLFIFVFKAILVCNCPLKLLFKFIRFISTIEMNSFCFRYEYSMRYVCVYSWRCMSIIETYERLYDEHCSKSHLFIFVVKFWQIERIRFLLYFGRQIKNYTDFFPTLCIKFFSTLGTHFVYRAIKHLL